MNNSFIVQLFEHNNWANLKIVQACMTLNDDQLDAEPHSATKGNIRQTLVHLVKSQRRYQALLTLPLEARPTEPLQFDELLGSIRISGEGLLALAKGEQTPLQDPLLTSDGYCTAPWVVMVQVINHASEHREQIKSMLSALGITPPDITGWDFGEATRALIPIST
jgi:uncharacterized damage-inducible protein DinB